MRCRSLILSLSILAAQPFVNAAGLKENPFREFFENAVNTSERAVLEPGPAKISDLKPGSQLRTLEVDSDSTTDSLDHSYEIVLSSGKIDHVLLSSGHDMNSGLNESYYFK